jgi:ferredoxin
MSSAEAVIVRYADRPIVGRVGQRLLDVILDAGIEHRHICGGNGFCTSCRVEVVAGVGALSPVSALERDRLGSDAGPLRLACQAHIVGPAEVRVPLPRTGGFSPEGS